MIFSANSPQYLPDINFFHLMKHSDKYVIADDNQFVKHSMINRTKINTLHGPLYLTVPVLSKNRIYQKLNDVRIVNDSDWQKKHWKTILHNYKFSPYFDHYAHFFCQLYTKKWHYLIDLNMTLIGKFREILMINSELIFSSTLNLDTKGNEKIIQIAKRINCHQYAVNCCYQHYLDNSLFNQNDIELVVLDNYSPKLDQSEHIKLNYDLSVIDLLFNLGPDSNHMI